MAKAKDIFFIGVITLMMVGTAAINKANAAPTPTAKAYKVNGKTYQPMKSVSNFNQTGKASWYGPGFHGRKTSNGERFNMYALTAAHRTLPIPSYVRVTNLANGKTVVVRVNDRGPFHGNRVIDLSKGAASQLGFVGQGMAQVRIESLENAQVATKAQADKFEKVAVEMPVVPRLNVNKINKQKMTEKQAATVARTLAKTTLSQTALAAFAPKDSSFYLDSQIFKTAKDANAHMLRMAATLRDAQINYPLVVVQNGNGYQVRIGPFKESKFADELKKQLSSMNNHTNI